MMKDDFEFLRGLANCQDKEQMARYIEEHQPKPMTNADRIRAMSDEELAALICKHRPMCSWPKGVQKIFYSTRMTGVEAWTHWLRQTAEVENGV